VFVTFSCPRPCSNSRRTAIFVGAVEALPRGSDRRADCPDSVGSEHLVEAGRELPVSVPNQETDSHCSFGEDRGPVASLLGYPPSHRADVTPIR
jgi:hypothetical protein